jgi:hypothetical protein
MFERYGALIWLAMQPALTVAIRIARPNPDSQAHQQVAAADTMEQPPVVGMAAGTVAWEQAVVAVRYTSPTSVASLPYVREPPGEQLC